MNNMDVLLEKLNKILLPPPGRRGGGNDAATSMLYEADVKNSLLTAALLGSSLFTGCDKSSTAFPKTPSATTINKDIEQHSVAKRMLIKDAALGAAIDIDKIIKIESSGDPKAVNKRTGARGLCQIMKSTWLEMTKKMGKDWQWNEAFDPIKNREVGEYYINVEIPRLLKHYNLGDTYEKRLVAYNWGIGHLVKIIKNHPKDWSSLLPEETKSYIIKYKGMNEYINESLEWVEGDINDIQINDIIKWNEAVFAKDSFVKSLRDYSYKIRPISRRTIEGKVLSIKDKFIIIECIKCFSTPNHAIEIGSKLKRTKDKLSTNLTRRVRAGEIKMQAEQGTFDFMKEKIA